MLNHNEQPAKAQTGEHKDNPQSFTPAQLKDLSSEEGEDLELSEGELGRISGGLSGHPWFKLEQESLKRLNRLT